jgi:hypothetical protein
VLRTRSPLIHGPKPASPFDLHVLGAPPAFVLSQDQTLRRDLRPSDPKVVRPWILMESAGAKRHLPADLFLTRSPRGRAAHVCISVRIRTWRTTPRSDGALAFTRCSVLKVRAAGQGSPRDAGKLFAGESAPTDDGTSPAADVNFGGSA